MGAIDSMNLTFLFITTTVRCRVQHELLQQSRSVGRYSHEFENDFLLRRAIYEREAAY